MNVRFSTEKAEWNALVEAASKLSRGTQFLQSWEWGAMQQAYGRNVLRVVVKHVGKPVLAVQMVLYPLPKGRNYFFAPRGPLVFTENPAQLGEAHLLLMNAPEVQKEFKQHNVVFLRTEPTNRVYAEVAGGVEVADVTPADSVVIDLAAHQQDDTTDAVLAAMKQKTRYNIRLAGKKGVETRVIDATATPQEWAEATERLITLIEETAQRHGIRPHPAEYYRTQVQELGPSGFLTLGEAWHEGDLLTANMYIHFGDTSTYLHGASSNAKKNLMAPYALQWEAIQQALAQGKQQYDFYGVAPVGSKEHKLAGVTRFKEGYGGQRIQYPGTREFPISGVWYMIYRTIKRLRSGK